MVISNFCAPIPWIGLDSTTDHDDYKEVKKTCWRQLHQTTVTPEALSTMKASAAPICGLIVVTTASVLSPRAVNCNGDSFDLTVENWNKLKVDESIRAFWDGGKDAEGVDWPGVNTYGSPRAFTTMLGTRLQNKGVWTCSGMPFDGRCDAEPCTGTLTHR